MHKTFGKYTQTTDWNYELVSPLHLIWLLYKVCQYLGPGIRSSLVTPLLTYISTLVAIAITNHILICIHPDSSKPPPVLNMFIQIVISVPHNKFHHYCCHGDHIIYYYVAKNFPGVKSYQLLT